MTRTVLVTGFGSFPGVEKNPSAALIRAATRKPSVIARRLDERLSRASRHMGDA
ncbi:hypothetical protein [Breoghania sp.]|uniref:hypothetical protein n=1 Tax=Breoghania sp. TaxID=2065378 RepID=UPI0026284E3F|nr:hypothetical protein [Breoghania sp.]MDJ0931767.1 hypothetical protein [Breoghania sp.]